ncbi:MAG: hypothetical protein KW793_04865 [Candidatus Doudnabacteria bacterium]|nr:hypothetical protein [Candidatus Doudnabacteria bacterium]
MSTGCKAKLAEQSAISSYYELTSELEKQIEKEAEAAAKALIDLPPSDKAIWIQGYKSALVRYAGHPVYIGTKKK